MAKKEDTSKVRLQRAIRPKELREMKFDVKPFTNEWLSLIGSPVFERTWFIFGDSGNGKTRFALQLAKYLTNFGHVLYYSLEEGKSHSMQLASHDLNLDERNAKFKLVDQERHLTALESLRLRLTQTRQNDIVFIDSVQYLKFKNTAEYFQLINDYPNVQFVIVSQADGKNVKGAIADDIRYDSGVVIWVEGFRAFCKKSRYGGRGSYTINHQRAAEYWNILD